IALHMEKYKANNYKRISLNLPIPSFDKAHAIKISIFLTSMIVNIASPSTNLWLHYILSSLSRKPKMISSLYAILYTAGVISHSQRYERRLEKLCLSESKPENRLIREN